VPSNSDWLQRAREATPENAETTAAVVEIAEAWQRGEMPLAAARRACTGHDRFVAMNHEKARVMPLIDALARDQDEREGAIMTKHGLFTRADIESARGSITHDCNGRRVLQFAFDVDAIGRPMYRVIPEWKLDEQPDPDPAGEEG
jgi:hypothetical protein